MRPTIKAIAQRMVMVALLMLCAWPVGAQNTYTILPTPYFTGFDNNGAIVSGGCLWTYAAGTTTPVATYADTVGTSNANPVILDSAGRATVYLVSGQSYKFVLEQPCTPPAHGAVLRTQDQIGAIPGSTSVVAVLGTAGINIAAGQAVYMSDGSNALVAGKWYVADSGNAYSSTTPTIGIATAAIATNATGSITLSGEVTGLTSLSPGAAYYVSSSGTVTTTAPGNPRYVGQADTSTSIVLSANPSPMLSMNLPFVDDFRLTLTTGLCVTTADVVTTNAVTIFWAPCTGNRITLFNSAGTLSEICTTAQLSKAVPATTATMYDVFISDSAFGSCTVSLSFVAWTNQTTRATALDHINGRLVEHNADQNMYLGSFTTTGTSGQTEDSLANRLVWNYYNRRLRPVSVLESTATWAYTTQTWREARGQTTNQIGVVIGVAEDSLHLQVTAWASNSSANIPFSIGIGQNSTTAPLTSTTGGTVAFLDTGGSVPARLDVTADLIPAVGFSFFAWLEISNATATTTWVGVAGSPGVKQSGIVGWVVG